MGRLHVPGEISKKNVEIQPFANLTIEKNVTKIPRKLIAGSLKLDQLKEDILNE